MGFPEFCYQGGALVITGRVLEAVSVVGWAPYLKFRNGVSLDPIPGSWVSVAQRTFNFHVAQDVTATFPLGTLAYEVYILHPSGEEFVCEQGSLEVIPRL